MARPDPPDSEPEQSESSGSEEEIEEPGSNGQKQDEISGYEKQRLSRIAENKARMEALGISKVVSSLMGSSQNPKPSNKRKGKRKIDEDDDDEDFRPNDDADDIDDVDDEDDDELLADVASRSRKRKVKGKDKSPKPKKKAPVRKQLASSDHIDEEDDELMQALALSLQLSSEVSGPTPNERKNVGSREDARKGKSKKSFTSRVQMTEDEVVLHFFQFDGSEKGGLSMRDIRRVATAHDFTWTDDELADMIRCFDSDGDGKLNLDDFRKIVSRCNMLRTSENSTVSKS